ncbi:DUF3667 domain-containing protein [Xanthomarina sp. F1114]|uniref:DUF3667 domain-containing protein n=1 Tax=Xanthomarina sp. F1114 TaxID=2996019 RepID=UPI00225E29C8|nr:DUF3667 domain-containing protein [Xanthomarina sp. F1114]MCX7549184.1 DUF3667 domain-containing protein [Xanthomarina sp. F1114]
MICKNCEQNFNGNYCSNCGQNSNVRKVDYKYLINEIPNSIFQINRGFLFTLKELFTRPGHSIREFLEGKRKNHFKPLAFIIFTSTLYVLAHYFIGNQTFIDDAISGYKTGGKVENSDLINWISKNQTYVILILVPFFSLASYLAFLKSKYNYFEHLVLNIYITGQQMFIYFIFSFIFDRNSYLILLPLLLGMAFNFWTYIQFFNKKSTFKKMLLIVLTYIIFLILIIMGMIVISIAIKTLE